MLTLFCCNIFQALSATVATIIAQPFEQLAEALGKSFRALFREVPIQWQPFVFIAVIIIIVIAMFVLSGLQVKSPFLTLTTAPAIPGNFQTQLRQLTGLATLQGDIRNKQTEILNLLKTISEYQEKSAELAIQGDMSQKKQGASSAAEVAAEGAEEKKPVEQSIMESNKCKLPVQNSEQDTKVAVEDVGPSEGT